MVLINIGLVPGRGICRWINLYSVKSFVSFQQMLWEQASWTEVQWRVSRARSSGSCPPRLGAEPPVLKALGRQGGANPLYPVGHRCPRSRHRGHQGLHDRMGEEKCVWSLAPQGPGSLGRRWRPSQAPSEQVLGKAGAGAQLTSLSSQPLFSSSHTCEEASGSRRLVDSG